MNRTPSLSMRRDVPRNLILEENQFIGKPASRIDTPRRAFADKKNVVGITPSSKKKLLDIVKPPPSAIEEEGPPRFQFEDTVSKKAATETERTISDLLCQVPSEERIDTCDRYGCLDDSNYGLMDNQQDSTVSLEDARLTEVNFDLDSYGPIEHCSFDPIEEADEENALLFREHRNAPFVILEETPYTRVCVESSLYDIDEEQQPYIVF